MTMSGPLLTFAATAALGRTSSQLSRSTRTLIPVFSSYFLVFATHSSLSPATNSFQRRTGGLAPSPGGSSHPGALAGRTTPPVAATAPAATPALSTSRLLKPDIKRPPVVPFRRAGERPFQL